MTGLRMAEGLDLERLERQSGQDWQTMIDAGRIDELVAGGFLRQAPGRLTATPAGMLRLNALLAALLTPDLDETDGESGLDTGRDTDTNAG